MLGKRRPEPAGRGGQLLARQDPTRGEAFGRRPGPGLLFSLLFFFSRLDGGGSGENLGYRLRLLAHADNSFYSELGARKFSP